MIITMVIDQYGYENNGTTISTRRFVEALRSHGHTVRICAACPKDLPKEQDVFAMKERFVPIASHVAKKQGILFGSPDPTLFREAFRDADVIHFLMPFHFDKIGLEIAQEMDKPITAAFHVQPENVTSNVFGLNRFEPANRMIYNIFHRFYRNFTHIHCPSQFIADELARNGYSEAKLHVISNGVGSTFTPDRKAKPDRWKDKFVILNIGRMSPEKRQDVLIEAVRGSKYRDKIQILFAGKGPKLKKYSKMGETLPNPPHFGFYTKDELVNVINYSDLYVHSADIEIEAIACVEAFTCGLVPVIADSPKSATKQFALHQEHNLFRHGDVSDLTAKIDKMYEDRQLLRTLSEEYVGYAKQFSVDYSVLKIEDMFHEAIREHKLKKLIKITSERSSYRRAEEAY